MVRFKPFSASALLLFPAFVLLLLTVISAPITRFSSLGSASDTKFGVFGYCYNNGSCSSIQIGYDTDSIISRVNTGALSRRSELGVTQDVRLVKRQLQSGNNNFDQGQNAPSFNLPDGTRENLSNILVVHVVAAGFTLILFLLAAFGHLKGPSNSPAYMLVLILLSVLTLALTLLSFLIDILIFVPNLDWGTWITLVATILNALASILLCAARRTLKTRRAMHKRIAENDDMNTQSYYNAQHLHDPEPVAAPVMAETDKATLPHFVQFEYDHPETEQNETMPLTGVYPDNRSSRSETPSLTSPPKYPTIGTVFNDAHEMRELQPSTALDTSYNRARIPFANPPRQVQSQYRPSRMSNRNSSDSFNHANQGVIAPPLEHASTPADREFVQQGYEARRSPREGEDLIQAAPLARDEDDRPARDAQGRQPRPPRDMRQRVVSGPRPMPNEAPPQRQYQRPLRSNSGSYYEDAPPQFDQGPLGKYQDDQFLEPRLPRGHRQHTPRGSGLFERPPYPNQPRSPDTISNSSHFTSVSQRGVNPAWRGDGMPPSDMPQQPYARLPRQDRQRAPTAKPNILADNPDFIMPGAGPSRNRLPGSRRPNAIPGLSASALGKGASPYAITKDF